MCVPTRTFSADKLNVKIYASRKEMGTAAAGEASAAISRLLKEKEQINILFAAAPSQNEFLAALQADPSIDWSRINAFHMDEYIGLDASHPAGFRNFLRHAIFDRVPFRSVNLLNGNADDPEAEAVRYSELLRTNPLDLCFCGIGENGHLAFNDPPVADFHDPVLVKVVKLDETCRMQQVHDGCFQSLEEVPTHALSVTVPGLTAAKQIFCMVPAPTKAEAVRHTVSDIIGEHCPATALRLHADATLYLDPDSSRSI